MRVRYLAIAYFLCSLTANGSDWDASEEFSPQSGLRNYCVQQGVDHIEAQFGQEIQVQRVLFEKINGRSERLRTMWIWTDLCDGAFAFNMRPIHIDRCTQHHIGRVPKYYRQAWAGCSSWE